MLATKGFSLLELLICLGLISLLAIVTPITAELMQKNQLQLVVDELSSALHFTRNMALSKGINLAVTAMPNTNNWSKGMLVFVDNKTHSYGENDKLIYQWQWKHRGIQIDWKGFQSDHYLIFSANLQHAATSGHFTITARGREQKKLVINRFGRIYSLSFRKDI